MTKLFLMIIFSLGMSLTAFASAEQDEARFLAAKRQMVDHMRENQEQVAKELACVKSANVQADLVICQKQMIDFHERMGRQMRTAAKELNYGTGPKKPAAKAFYLND